MGLFGSSKKIYVSSVVYNLAGDEDDRPNYLKTTVVGGLLTDTGASLGDTVATSYLTGPGISLRAFARWARKSGYNDLIGLDAPVINSGSIIDVSVLAQQIPHGPTETVVVQTSAIGPADYTFWADQYILQNHPTLISTEYSTDFDEATNTIHIRDAAGVHVASFSPVGFDSQARYLYASYVRTGGETHGPVVPGPWVVLASGDDFPNTAVGWTENFLNDTSAPIELVTQVKTVSWFSDGRPNEETTTTSTVTQTAINIYGEWEKTVYQGRSATQDAVTSLRTVVTKQHTSYKNTTSTSVTAPPVNIGGGVTKTTQTTTTTDFIQEERRYKKDTQVITHKSWGPLQIFIYKELSGNGVLDAMFPVQKEIGGFFPFIPFRVDNKFVSPTFLADVYPEAKKAYRRSVTGRFDRTIDDLSENESLEDIDYAYTVFGVSLNVKENACKEYIYRFFKEILMSNGNGEADYVNWRDRWEAAQASKEAWEIWKRAQDGGPGTPGYGDPEPALIPYPTRNLNSFRVSSKNRPVMNYDILVSWWGIEEGTGTGLIKPGAKKGDLWFSFEGNEDFGETVYQQGEFPTYIGNRVSRIRLYWQDSRTSHRYLDIWGLKHQNFIYGGKSVDIEAEDALKDDEESGFIIPLHEGIYRDMPLLVATQMATACCFMVFNCYTVVKRRWYERVLKVLLIVVVIAVAIYTAGTGTGFMSSGLLGSNSAIGVGLGFSGTAALVAGAVANSIAAMIVMQVIQTGAVAIFGEKLGALIGAIAGFFAIYAGTAVMNGQTMSSVYSGLMRADNLMKLTGSLSSGISGYLQASAKEYITQAQELVEDYERRSKEISDMYDNLFGTGGKVVLDPLEITSAGWYSYEPSESYLQRTLMTGSDIAELSNSLLTNFARNTLQIDLPG